MYQPIFQLFQPLVPNEVDEQIETDEQISIENNDPIENDNNNLPKSPRNQQTENSFLVTPNGLVMESHKSARKKNIKIYMVLPENKSPCQVSEIVNHPKSAMNNSDQDVQSSNAEKSNNSRLYSILDFEKPKLWRNKAILPSFQHIHHVFPDFLARINCFWHTMTHGALLIDYDRSTWFNKTIWLVLMNVKVD